MEETMFTRVFAIIDSQRKLMPAEAHGL